MLIVHCLLKYKHTAGSVGAPHVLGLGARQTRASMVLHTKEHAWRRDRPALASCDTCARLVVERQPRASLPV
jgi:hypothetical protein